MFRRVALILVVSVSVASCAGGTSLAEYAEQVEHLVNDMNQRRDDAVREEPSPPTVEGARVLWAELAGSRRDFVDALGSLEPPDSAADVHQTALDLVTRLAEAETAIADKTVSTDTMEEMFALMSGPEAQVFVELDAEATEFCWAAQAQMDATSSAEAFADMPFIPREMQAVVVVAFRCTAEERGLEP